MWYGRKLEVKRNNDVYDIVYNIECTTGLEESEEEEKCVSVCE